MKIVGVKFNNNTKVYYFNSNGLDLKVNLTVIVNTDKGLKFGRIVEIVDSKRENDAYPEVVRVATKKDFQQYLRNIQDEKKALEKCRELSFKENLNMTIIDANYNFDKSQLIFRFLADERIDFRKLAKDLASNLKTRIELRQIGVRDKAKEIGGIGPCGRILCCSSFLTNFEGIALNPTKINGVCGRLLCCLNYENEQYMEVRKNIPDVGKKVKINGKEGKVISSEPLAGKYKVFVDNEIVQVDVNDSKE
jgi:cell fate regulator YaaT (PSP1 superfamily)